MSASNWTGRTARTLYDAFGPHTSTDIDEAGTKWHAKPLLLLAAASGAVLACWAVAAALFAWSQQ
jgi:hypothetical protein